MAIDQESFNKKLYDLLKTRGYRPVPKDSKNERTESPQDADVFNFTFVKGGEELGDAWVTIDDAQDVILYYDDDIMDTGERSAGSEYDDSWSAFIQHLKRWAMSKQLGFELRDKTKLGDDMAQREYTKKKENISEGYYPMGKQSSYSDAVPTVKIILQHTRQIQEGEQRYRNVARIFLENQVGERILAPTTRPGIAQVYARHLAEGGVPNDERWNHIKSLCEEYQKMAGFVRATRGNQFNESAQRLVNEGVNHYHNLRETLGKMRGHRGYHKYFESYTPALMETEGDESNLTELFVQETLDPRIESVMPILSRLQKNVSEMREVNELAEWASSLLEGGDGPEASEEQDGNTAGDAGEGGGEDAPEDDLMEAPGAETLAHNQNTEKGNLKAFDLEEDSEDKKLSRKLKANIDHIHSKLKDPNLSDADKKDLNFKLKIYSDRLGKKKDTEEPDTHYSDDTKQSQLAKAAQDRVRNTEKKTASDLLHGTTGLEEAEVEESGLQAYLGNKKYGKEGMDALRKAGREGASKEKMASIRAKYAKLDEEGVAEGLLDKFIKPEMKFKIDDYDEELHVSVTLGGERVASAVFNVVGNDLKAQDLSVRPKYRGQGIAKKMYDMLKSKGYTINRSQEQTAAGSHFWDKNKGRGSKVWEQGVAEDTNELGYHTRVRRGDFRPSKYGEDEYNYLHDLMNTSGDGSGPMLVTIDDKKIARQIAAMYGGDVEETGLGTYRIVQRRGNSPMGNEMPKLTGVAEGTGNKLEKQAKLISSELYNQAYEYVGNLKKWQNRDYDRSFDNQVDSIYSKLVDKFLKTNPEYHSYFYGEQGVAEDLDANQKRVGQLGPTEKVGPKGAVGKLVGANESRLNEMDSEGYKGHRGDEDKGKGPDKTVKPAKAKATVKDAEKALNKAMDKAHKKDVKEGQEELDAMLRLLGK